MCNDVQTGLASTRPSDGLHLFAQYLRGPAALLVVVSHVFGVFWSHQTNVARLLGVAQVKAVAAPIPFIVSFENLIGQIGVGIFFLISGFVIANSVERTPSGVFMARRIVRIYPVYIAAFLVTMLAIWLAVLAFDGTFRYRATEMIVHVMIVPREWLGFRNIDGVSWTLEIEMTFYIVMALAGGLILRGGARALFAASLLFAAFGLAFSAFAGWDWIARHLASLPLLFAGVAFFLHHTDRLSTSGVGFFVGFGLVASAVVMASTRRYAPGWETWIAGYAIGAAVFAAAYALRDRFSRSAMLDHFASISYPLYASHIFVGYAVMYAVIAHKGSAWIAVGAALFAAYVIAVALHFGIERPTSRMSKNLGRKPTGLLTPVGASSATPGEMRVQAIDHV